MNGRAGDSSWRTPPPGYLGVSEAARILGVTPQAVRKMLTKTPAALQAARVPHHGGRTRVWVTRESVHRLTAEREVGNRHRRAAVPDPADEAADGLGLQTERDQWRTRALRAEQAHIERSVAEAELAAARAARTEAERHLRNYADALHEALDRTTAACDHYRAALDAFTLPSDAGDLIDDSQST